MKKVTTITTGLLVLFCAMAFINSNRGQQPGIWKAPAYADKISNPLKGNSQAILAGKKIFAQNCAPCHGYKGKGDGIAGVMLKPRPANLISGRVQGQTDGAIFWKITTGRTPMASYKNVFNEVQRWDLVDYIRSLK